MSTQIIAFFNASLNWNKAIERDNITVAVKSNDHNDPPIQPTFTPSWASPPPPPPPPLQPHPSPSSTCIQPPTTPSKPPSSPILPIPPNAGPSRPFPPRPSPRTPSRSWPVGALHPLLPEICYFTLQEEWVWEAGGICDNENWARETIFLLDSPRPLLFSRLGLVNSRGQPSTTWFTEVWFWKHKIQQYKYHLF